MATSDQEAPSKKEELFLGAMSIMAAADGTISAEETSVIRSLAESIPELDEAELTTLIPNAAVAIRTAKKHPEWIRKKAFVLGVEVVTRGNEAAYKEGDANLRGIGMLQSTFELPNAFTQGALTTIGAKYRGGLASDVLIATMVDAVLYVATATKTSISRLRRVANILEMVPQLANREIIELFHVPRLIAGKPLPMLEAKGAEALADRLKSLPDYRDKTFVLACEVAIALGVDAKTHEALMLVETALDLTKESAVVRDTWTAKYASGPWTGFAK